MFSVTLRVWSLVLAGGVASAAVDLDRELVLTPQAGDAVEDREIARWQERARAKEARAEVFEQLAWAYVAKARTTLDAGFYKLAEKASEVAGKIGGAGPAVRLVRGHVLHNLHRFAEAETIARGLVAERGRPEDLALLSDTLVEQGKLGEAVDLLQDLVNRRPGLEAYSRIAYVRWLKGDVAGAVTALGEAGRAADPQASETRAWVLVRLSALALQQGDLASAGALAESAGPGVSDYAPALLAQGRVLMARGEAEKAVVVLRRAAELNPLPEYQWWLADALRAAGRSHDAAKVESRLRRGGESGDPRTLALFLATRGESAALAVRLAQAELAQRRDVFTYDAVAWAWLAAGDREAAAAAMRRALAEGTRDARLFWHAAEIAEACGEAHQARDFLARAEGMAGTLTPSERARFEAATGRLTGTS